MSIAHERTGPRQERPLSEEEGAPGMSDETSPEYESEAEEFARQAEEASTGLLRESFDFLRHNKKWWLTPIVVVLLLVSVFLFMASTGAAPFIYTLF